MMIYNPVANFGHHPLFKGPQDSVATKTVLELPKTRNSENSKSNSYNLGSISDTRRKIKQNVEYENFRYLLSSL